MFCHVITAEIGSTITKVNGFSLGGDHIAQGFSLTTVDSGDVSTGLINALNNLEYINGFDLAYKTVSGPKVQNSRSLKQVPDLTWNKLYANSSAAGGLKMTVHGLTMDMTARAAREASLGAGAIVKLITAGKMRKSKVKAIADNLPNIILLAGGVDHGEEETVIHNAEQLTQLPAMLSVKSKLPPVIYAGNRAVTDEVIDILGPAGFKVITCENVYPGLDELNVDPARKVIMDLFADHIIHAPGMEFLEHAADNRVVPTPAAVLRCAEIIHDLMGDIAVIDVGGATTDIHSVTNGSDKYRKLQTDPEPLSKRTVEGDLGVFVNATTLNNISSESESMGALDLNRLSPMPTEGEALNLSSELAARAALIGFKRHAGKIRSLFISTGKKVTVKGRDLTGVKWLFGTGGAFTKIPGGKNILKSLCIGDEAGRLFPHEGTKVAIDKAYIFSAIGTIAFNDKDFAAKVMTKYIDRLENKN